MEGKETDTRDGNGEEVGEGGGGEREKPKWGREGGRETERE